MRQYIPFRLAIPVILIATAILLELGSHLYEQEVTHEQLERHAGHENRTINHMGGLIELALQTGGEGRANDIIAALAADGDVLSIRLIDENGTIIASSRSGEPGSAHRGGGPWDRLSGAAPPAYLIEGNTLFSRQPLTLPGNRSGAILVESDLTHERERADAHLLTHSLASGAAIVLAALLLWFYFNLTVNRRILLLQRTADAIGQGRLETRADIGSGDELGDLALSMNRMAAQLGSQQEYLGAIHDTLDEHAMLAIHDSDGHLLQVNERFCQVSGHSRSDLIGSRYGTPSAQESAAGTGGNLVRHGILQERRKDGTAYWVESTTVPIPAADGTPQRHITIRTDVSRRQRMRDAMELLATSDGDAYNTIAKAVCTALECRWAGFGLLSSDRKRVDVLGFWANDAPAPLFTYELAGTPCADVCSRDKPLVITTDVARLYPEDTMLADIAAISYRGEPLDDEGEVIGVLFAIDDAPCSEDEEQRSWLRMAAKRAVLDIKRKESEGALIASERRLRKERDFVDAVLHEAGTVIVVLDRHGHIIRFNRHAEEITGYSFAELHGTPLWDSVIPADFRDRIRNLFDNLEEGGIAGRHEHEWVMKDGRQRLFDWRNTVLTDESGRITNVVIQGLDINDQRQAARLMAQDHERQVVLRRLLETVIRDSQEMLGTMTLCLQTLLDSSAISAGAGGGIYIRRDSQRLELLTQYNLPEHERERCTELAARECHIATAAQLQESPPPPGQACSSSNCGNCGHYCLPLLSSSGILGALVLHFPDCRDDAPATGRFLESVADILAGYIHRKRHEQARREHENIYRSVAETSNDGFWISDMAGRILEVNQAYARLSGYAIEELCHMTVAQLEAKESEKEIAARISRIVAKGHDLFESCHRAKDGSPIPVEVSISHWPLSGGRLFVFVRDIRDRKESEKSLAEYRDHLEELVATKTLELRDAYRQLESIIENLPAVFYIRDGQGRYTMVNRRFEETAGVTREQINGAAGERPPLAEDGLLTAHPHQGPALVALESPITAEERIRHPDGTLHDYLTTRLPLGNGQGQEAAVMVIMADITEQKQLQRELSSAMGDLQRRAALEHLVSTITSQLIGIEPETLSGAIGRVLAEIGGFTRSERCALLEFDASQTLLTTTHQWCAPWSRLPRAPERHATAAPLQETFTQLRNERALDIRASATGPFQPWLEVAGARSLLLLPVSHGGTLLGAIELSSRSDSPGWTKSDIELLQTQAILLGQALHSSDTQRALRAAKEEAERLARAKSEFLANMSHEIRTPLNAVLGLAQIGTRDSEGRKAQKSFGRIFKSGKHLLGLVNDILDFSKLEAGKLTTERVLFSLGDVIDQAVTFIAADARHKGLDFVVNEAPGLPGMVSGDPMRLTQVLTNLLGNALKFTEKGAITFTLRNDGSNLIIEVQDSGIGISPEQASRLFRPFEQADNSTTRRFGGTGLGLAISHRLIKAMGGSITIDSEPGRGSRFQIILPITTGTEQPPAWQSSCPVLITAELPGFVMADLRRKTAEANIPLRESGTLTALAAAEPGCILIASEVLHEEQIARAALDAAAQGRHIILFNIPGQDNPLPSALRCALPAIEWPIRLRNLAHATIDSCEVPAATGGARLGGLTLLAVEDIELNRAVLADILLHEGAEVVFAENGQAAIERVEECHTPFDVILMDIQMPVMDGYEATRQIKQRAPQIPIIGLTAHAFAEERERCLAAGMCAHVSKPVDVETLITAILTHCGRGEEPLAAMVVQGRSSVERESQGAPEMTGLIDWPALRERYSHRCEFINKILGAALTTIHDTHEALQRALAQRDAGEIAFNAHAVKGSCGNIMAGTIMEQAATVEVLARNAAPTLFDECTVLIEALARLSAEMEEALKMAGDEMERKAQSK